MLGEIITSHVCLPEWLGGAGQMGGDAGRKARAWEVRGLKGETEGQGLHYGLGP